MWFIWLARRRARKALEARERLEPSQWCEMVAPVAPDVAQFVLSAFGGISGLDMLRTRPDDDLGQLGFPSVAFSDWEFDVVEEFSEAFNVQVRLKDAPESIRTLRDWAQFLDAARTRASAGGTPSAPTRSEG
jgi:hypothetical protein